MNCQNKLNKRAKTQNTGNNHIFITIMCRAKTMDDWLMQKKLSEAQKIAQLRELEEKEQIERQMREEHNYKSYREWLKKQMLRDKHDRYNNLVRKQDFANKEKEDYVKMRTDAMME